MVLTECVTCHERMYKVWKPKSMRGKSSSSSAWAHACSMKPKIWKKVNGKEYILQKAVSSCRCVKCGHAYGSCLGCQ